MAFARKEIVDIFNKVKYPYNVNGLTQRQALEMLKEPYEIDKWVKIILLERSRMVEAVGMLGFCKTIYRTDSNFILVKVDDVQLPERQRHNRKKPYNGKPVRRLPAHNHWKQRRKQRTAFRPAPILKRTARPFISLYFKTVNGQ